MKEYIFMINGNIFKFKAEAFHVNTDNSIELIKNHQIIAVFRVYEFWCLSEIFV